MRICDRCRNESKTFTGSMFNTEMICMECKRKENEHPLYELARDKEMEEVRRGNMNYEGIGLPDDLKR